MFYGDGSENHWLDQLKKGASLPAKHPDLGVGFLTLLAEGVAYWNGAPVSIEVAVLAIGLTTAIIANKKKGKG